jgi:hypothetical protein
MSSLSTKPAHKMINFPACCQKKQGDTTGAAEDPIGEAAGHIEWEPSDNYALISHLGAGKVRVGVEIV